MHTNAPPPLPDYAELQCLSNFSFLRGASHPEELVEQANQLGYTALAITDECSLAGVVRAHVEAKAHAVRLLIGASFQLSGTAAPALVVLACGREGYGHLSTLITLARRRAAKGSYTVWPGDVAAPEAPHTALQGLPDCLVILTPAYGVSADTLQAQAQWVAATFPGRAWIALTLLQRNRDTAHRAVVQAAAQASGLPLVATGAVEMHLRSRKPLHDTLAAIRLGRPVAQCGYALAPNAEQHLRPRLRLAGLYPAQALAQTQVIAQRCTFSLDILRYEYPDEAVPAGATPTSHLRALTEAGARQRYPEGVPATVQAQIAHELAIIAHLQYEPYFLTVHDIVRYARSQNILCQGRGSAANSAVCFCLGITAVDPHHSTLLFERFISPERKEPPDIDVDFEHQRREEVIQYIYRRYGRTRAALAAVVISYRPRSALRDVGKALGIDHTLVDAAARSQQWWDSRQDLLDRLAQIGLDTESQVARQWASLTRTLMGFPRHLSQHPGGFVISNSPLAGLVPLENASMADRTVVQWDKDDLDAVGLLKIDVLALGMLTVLRRTMDLLPPPPGKPPGHAFTLTDIPADDPATYDMICAADTIGTFQIESRAQMSMLPRLKPRRYYDLVVQVAIVRPGPIQGGMVHPYLRRRQKLDPETYPHDDIRDVLSRTMGVPIFQEQVMQIAVVAAGFTPGEADNLRRAMASWRRKGGVDAFRARVIEGMCARGYAEDFAQAIFRQMEGFGEYGFPESHAASFALLAYASAWLKRHHPAAFLVGLLNAQPMGFYAPAQLVQDARRHGVEVRAADVLASEAHSTLEPGSLPHLPAVRLGLDRIKGLTQAAALRIVQTRHEHPFTRAAQLARHAGLSSHEMQALAQAGALASVAGHRRQAAWEAALPVSRDLLRHATDQDPTPALAVLTPQESLSADYRTLGLTLDQHPLVQLRAQLAARGLVTAREASDARDRRLLRVCGIVTGRQRPGTAKGTVFVTLEDETGYVNVIVNVDLAQTQRAELLGAPLLAVYGQWRCREGVGHLLAARLVDLSPLLGDLPTTSRNFH